MDYDAMKYFIFGITCTKIEQSSAASRSACACVLEWKEEG